MFTISESTRQDLLRLGYQGSITVVPIGIEPIATTARPKARTPTFIYVGRLAPSKRIDDILRAVARFRDAQGRARLLLVGEGPSPYVARLRTLAAELRLTDDVEFCGRLAAADKHREMGDAHMLLMASAREGWGLVVTEAAACGTPAVVYDVGGLRDAVRHEQTGLVVRPSPEHLAAGMLRLWSDEDLYRSVCAEAERWSHTFSFDAATRMIRDRVAT